MADDDKKPDVNGVQFKGLVVPLSKEIQAHGETLKELRFREPTAADIETCGSPVRIDFEGPNTLPKMRYEEAAMFAMMVQLAGVPPSSIKMMSAKDWQTAALFLAHRYFFPDLYIPVNEPQ